MWENVSESYPIDGFDNKIVRKGTLKALKLPTRGISFYLNGEHHHKKKCCDICVNANMKLI